MKENEDFVGVKAALLFEDKLLVYLRDDKPGLRFAGLWDFPGGGREGDETPADTLLREIKEEFSIQIDPKAIVWQKQYPAMIEQERKAYFCVVRLTKEDVGKIRFGTEGQRWEFIAADSFLSRDDVVPHLKLRFSDYLKATHKAADRGQGVADFLSLV